MGISNSVSATSDRSPLLPPVLRGWPVVLWRGGGSADPEAAAAALALIRAGRLFWPAPRAGAPAPRSLALDGADRMVAHDPARIAPDALEEVRGASGALADWLLLGGLLGEDSKALDLLAEAQGISPWTGAPLPLLEAVAAQTLLREAAMRARGPLRLIGMTRWKRGNLRPFLTGPDGPPSPGRAGDAPAVVWGAEAPPGALRVEDGFLRSVGLGLRHTPPLSLTIDRLPPYFDATRPNAFDAIVDDACFTPALLARARALRAKVVALRMTKYNLDGRDALPGTGGREAVLVPGQVAADASIRLGARMVRDDAALLAAARARFPDAFLLYKPHPDVVTGLRKGRADPTTAKALADATVLRADPAECLDWCDRVATITSLMGFEALLRGKAVTCFGHPFYAGWGLTDDAEPLPRRMRRLTLDELTAAALILYPRYVDPDTGLPAPPEVALAALAAMRDRAGTPTARAVRAWRYTVSWLLNRLG